MCTNIFKKSITGKLIWFLLMCTIICIGSVNSVYAESYSFSGGDGTDSNPYVVATPEDLLHISSSLDCSFVQVNDITLSGETVLPIGTEDTPFTGKYNGNGFIISNIVISSEDSTHIGLFGYSNGQIENVVLDNCFVNGYSKSSTIYGGALLGYNNGKILNSSVSATVELAAKQEKANTYVGGLCGFSSGVINNCSFSGSVTSKVLYVSSTAYAGGICGLNTYGNIQNCRNNGQVLAKGFTSSNSCAGGIAGESYSVISNCTNDGKVSATFSAITYAGGIAGKSYGASGCKNSGEIYANSQYTSTGTGLWNDTFSGGIIGFNNGTVSFCENTGVVHADSSTKSVIAGGIAGMNSSYSTIQDSKNSGRIYCEKSGGETRVGGIAGSSYLNSIIKRCCNTGSVTTAGNQRFSVGHGGGIVGCLQYGTVFQTCNHGNISIASDEYVPYLGGIAGGSSGTIIDCYNDGSLSLSYTPKDSWEDGGLCGGICGYSDSTISCCYNIGKISFDEYASVGGICGADSGQKENCFALVAYSDSTATVITDVASKEKETYTGFDFEDIWACSTENNEGRPYLKTQPSPNSDGWYKERSDLVPVSEIKLSKSEVNLAVGCNYKLKLQVLPMNSDTRQYVWESNNVDVATVSSDGVITGISTGSAVITAKMRDSDLSSSCTVTVSSHGSICGRLSEPLVEAEIQLCKEDGEIVLVSAAVNGYFSFENVDIGTYIIKSSDNRFVSKRVNTQDATFIEDVFLVASGDLNGNGSVASDDLQCLYEYLTSGNYNGKLKDDTEYFVKVADINGDGIVDVYDLQFLYESVSGLI